MKGTLLLKVEDLSVGYGDMLVLSEINLTLYDGEAIVVFGSNGSGKSTLLKTIAGLLKPWKGSIEFKGIEVSSLSPYERLRLGIALASDTKNLFLDMTVEENLVMGAYVKRKGLKDRLEKVYSFFPELAEVRKKLAGELSGGFQRMLSIGRAYMSEPKLLMIDELSLGLSPKVADRLGEILREINLKEGISLLLVEQEVYLARVLCRRGYVLDLERLIAEGDVEDLLSKDVVRKVYLGLWH